MFRPGRFRRIVLAVAIIATAVVAGAAASVLSIDRSRALPVSGPLKVSVVETLLEQPDGGPIALRLFLPRQEEDSSRPVLFYVPSWLGVRSDNDRSLTLLASCGFVVIASDDIVHDPPRADAQADQEAIRRASFSLETAADFAAFPGLSRDRTLLAQQKLSRLADALTAGAIVTGDVRVDPGRIGVLGFSFGGAAASAALAADRRFRAAVNLDGWVADTMIEDGADRPFMGLFARVTTAQMPEWLWPSRYWTLRLFERELVVMRRLEANGARILFVSNVGHGDFADGLYAAGRWRQWRPWRPRVLSAPAMRDVLHHHVTGFFARHLGADACPDLPRVPDDAVVQPVGSAYQATVSRRDAARIARTSP